jgi:cell shape-determining protein MreC
MRIILFVLCVLSFLLGATLLSAATSAIHEIEAFIFFLISAVLLSGAAIVEAIGKFEKRYRDNTDDDADEEEEDEENEEDDEDEEEVKESRRKPRR